MNSKVNSDLNKPKKPYCRPALQVYGDIRAMTRNSNVGAIGDGMSGAGMTKTA